MANSVPPDAGGPDVVAGDGLQLGQGGALAEQPEPLLAASRCRRSWAVATDRRHGECAPGGAAGKKMPP